MYNISSTSPIRIAYIIGKMWAGGVETVVFNYYRAINHDKYQFDFYYDADSTVDPPQDLIAMGARFFMLPPYQHLPEYLRELRTHLKKEKYNIVHSHLNTLSLFPLYAAWKENVPIRIAHNHSVPGGNEFRRNVAKQVLRRLSKLFSTDYFACSEKAGRWMFGDKAFDDGLVYLVKNAIDFKKFQISENEISTLKGNLGIHDNFVVGHIGRFTYAKNHPFLLDIFKEIVKIKPDAILLLVGDGELHDEIIEGIKKRKIERNVVLTGKVQNPEKYYRLCDIIILPSIFEGLSMTTIESQASGVPVVISKAIPEEAVISDGCIYMEDGKTAVDWATIAIQEANRVLHYTEKAAEYDIKTQAICLENKYDELLKDQICKH